MTRQGEALDADSAALSAAGSAAEEALALHRSALAMLDDGWGGESGSAATDVVRRQCASAADLVEALHGAAAELRALRDTLAGDGSGEFDGLGGDLSDHPGYAQASARVSDRAAPLFDTPVPPAAPTAVAVPPAPANPFDPTASSFPAWSAGASSLPNFGSAQLPDLGGTLGALVGQIADTLSPDGFSPDPADVGAENPAPTPAELTRASDHPAAPVGQPPPTPAGIPPTQPETVVPQQENASPTPLLAAELPPPPSEPAPSEPPPPIAQSPPDRASAPPGDTKTPCEIAADELPQVGQ